MSEQQTQPQVINTDLDFWVGDWTLDSLRPNEKEFSKDFGSNKIDKIQSGKVIHENFTSPGFTGESWSVYHPQTKTWRQTWVDNSGGYLVLNGGKVGDEFILNMTFPNDKWRMRFTNIKKDSFTWIWEQKTEADKWTPGWTVNYRRKK